MSDFDEFRLIEAYIKAECIIDVYGTELPPEIMGIVSEYSPWPLVYAMDRIISENYANCHQCIGCHSLAKKHAYLTDTLIDQLYTIHLITNHSSNPRFDSFLLNVSRISNRPLELYYYQILSRFIELHDYTGGKSYEYERNVFNFINSQLRNESEVFAYKLAALLADKPLFRLENIARITWRRKSGKDKELAQKHAKIYTVSEIMEIIIPMRFAHLGESEKNNAIASMFTWADSSLDPIIAVPNIYGTGIYVCKLWDMKMTRKEFRKFATPKYIGWVINEIACFKPGISESDGADCYALERYYSVCCTKDANKVAVGI
jgi:hypothetical protein